MAVTPHPSDGRSKLISVTPAGQERLRRSAEPLLAVGRAIDEALEGDPRAIRASLLDLRRALESVYDAQQGVS